jgi:ABC-2 type transport system ATP-binding protein
MLALEHVRKEFGSVRAVADVSFEIPSGSTFGLIGPNGAGKTTTMRMTLGILTPDGGSISWNGQRVDGTMRRRFGYLPEERGLYGKMPVRRQIAFFGRLHGLRRGDVASRTNLWIERLGLGEYADRPCAELSKGNQQKVQVACAALHRPELLILDEPFAGLDPVNAHNLLEILDELKSSGTTLVLSSHQMWQMEALCDRFCIITAGVNRAAGTLAQLRAAWPTRVLRVAPGSSAVRRELDRVEGARLIDAAGDRVDYEIPAATALPAVLRRLVDAEAVTAFEPIEPSLQDIYLRAIDAGGA